MLESNLWFITSNSYLHFQNVLFSLPSLISPKNTSLVQLKEPIKVKNHPTFYHKGIQNKRLNAEQKGEKELKLILAIKTVS